MGGLKYPWQQAYLEAVVETQPDKLGARVQVADDAVFERLLALEGSVGTDVEREELEDTMSYLRLLRTYSHHFQP